MKFLQQLRLIFVLFAIFRPQPGHAQILWEDFQLLNGSNLPSQWTGDRSKFKVEDGSLLSQSSVKDDVFYLNHQIQLMDSSEWEFDIDLNINTSSVNKVRIYLIHEVSQLMYLEIGGTKDRVSVFVTRQAVEDSLLWYGPSGETHKFKQRVRVRKAGDRFELSYFNKSLANYDSIGQWNWSSFNGRPNMRWEVHQSTASFFYKHRLNSVYVGPWRKDQQSPYIQGIDWVSRDTFLASFSEGIYPTPKAMIRIGSHSAKYEISGVKVKFWFDGQVSSGKQDVRFAGFRDKLGNTLSDTILSIQYWETEPAHYKDLVISEWMSDPTPPVGLPEVEYVELFNRGNRHLDLSNWSLSDSRETVEIPSVVLPIDSFVVLVDFKDTSITRSWQNVVYINLPSLNNATDWLQVNNSSGLVIDELDYNIQYFTPDWKRDGGFSVERVDLSFECDHSNLFAFSKNVMGGTPGSKNSHNIQLLDTVAPKVEGVVVSEDSLILTFSEKLQEIIQVHETIASLNELKTGSNTGVRLSFKWLNPPVFGEKFEITVPGVLDCSGNLSADTSLTIGLPALTHVGDVRISEILFDGYQEVEFIEIINVSDVTLQLSDLRLGRRVGQDWQLMTPIDKDRLIHPGDVVVLTNQKILLSEQYLTTINQNLVEVSDLMTLPNDGAIIGLFNRSGQFIDTVRYSEDNHHQLLAQTKGVSLERRNLDLTYTETNETFWQSSSSLDGFGTPGFHRKDIPKAGFHFTLKNDPVTPNGDGISDEVVVQVNNLPAGTIARFTVTTLSGSLVYKSHDQELISYGQMFVWHVTQHQAPVAPGIYVINSQYITPSGEQGNWRKLVTVVLD